MKKQVSILLQKFVTVTLRCTVCVATWALIFIQFEWLIVRVIKSGFMYILSRRFVQGWAIYINSIWRWRSGKTICLDGQPNDQRICLNRHCWHIGGGEEKLGGKCRFELRGRTPWSDRNNPGGRFRRKDVNIYQLHFIFILDESACGRRPVSSFFAQTHVPESKQLHVMPSWTFFDSLAQWKRHSVSAG